MDQIRAYACDSLLQLSHAGRDVGGVLYGSRSDGVIRIVTWRRIMCEYAEGDALQLSHRDRMNLAVEFEAARSNPELQDLRPVGWFVSHPHGSVSMTASDLVNFSNFFPESAQFTLVIHPTNSGRAEAGFFLRESDGSLRAEKSYKEFVIEPIEAQLPDPAPTSKKLFERKPAATPLSIAPSAQTPERAATPPSIALSAKTPERAATPLSSGPSAQMPERAASPLSIAPSEQAPEPAATPLSIGPSAPTPKRAASPLSIAPSEQTPKRAVEAPAFQIDEPLPSGDRWLWAIPILLALGIAGWLLYQNQKPAQRPQIGFRITSSNGRTAQLEWDPNSPVIRASDRGEINITDDGKTSQVQLSADQLRSGKTTYVAQSGDVGFEMMVYRPNGDPVRESTRFIAPETNAPAAAVQSAAPVQAAPPPAAQPAPPPVSTADQDALQQQIRQLKADLAKQRARADDLQNVVRILENRLTVESQQRQGKR